MLLVTLALLIANCVRGRLGLRDLIMLRNHQAELQTERDSLAADNARLALTVKRLESDNRYIENMIRRELGYSRPDELIYKFANSAPANP
jgi:cell division protein FtsB